MVFVAGITSAAFEDEIGGERGIDRHGGAVGEFVADNVAELDLSAINVCVIE